MRYIKFFEEGVFGFENMYVDNDGHKHNNLTHMLCVDDKIGELEDKYNLTIGKLYKIRKIEKWCFSFFDDNGFDLYINPAEISKNFSTEKTYDDYLRKQDMKKYNL